MNSEALITLFRFVVYFYKVFPLDRYEGGSSALCSVQKLLSPPSSLHSSQHLPKLPETTLGHQGPGTGTARNAQQLYPSHPGEASNVRLKMRLREVTNTVTNSD